MKMIENATKSVGRGQAKPDMQQQLLKEKWPLRLSNNLHPTPLYDMGLHGVMPLLYHNL